MRRIRRGLASSVQMIPSTASFRQRAESATMLLKRMDREEKRTTREVEEQPTPTPSEGPILERLEDLLAETAIYAVGDDQKAAMWKAPSVQTARDERKKCLWREGCESFSTPLRAMGEMGIGIELYFLLMREMAKLFSVMTVLHFPVLLLNSRTFSCADEDDARSSCSSNDFGGDGKIFFFLPRMSLGDACREGTIRLFLFGHHLRPSPEAIGMLYCATQLLTALSVLLFTLSMHKHVSERLNELQLQHAQVSQFSVLVTNIPPDADEQELVRHFHRRYDLSRPQVAYPIYGLDARGTSLLSGFLGAVALFFVEIIVVALLLRARGYFYFRTPTTFWSVWIALALLVSIAFGYVITAAARQQQLGRPVSVPPLAEEHAKLRAKREKQLLGVIGERKRRLRTAARAGTLSAVHRLPNSLRSSSSVLCNARCFKTKPLAKASTLWMMRSPDPHPVQDVEHLRAVPNLNQNQSRQKNPSHFMGKWVADVSLIRSNGELIRQYTNLRALWARVQCSRASVRRWSEKYGPAPNIHRCQKALNRLELLVERMKDAQRELSRSVDRKGIDETTGAFVTFEHEWSAYRCVQDYAHSRSSLLRNFFQPVNLRLHRRRRMNASQQRLSAGRLKGGSLARLSARSFAASSLQSTSAENDTVLSSSSPQDDENVPVRKMRMTRRQSGRRLSIDGSGYATLSMPISVKKAASPDDVLWENLGVPGYVKNLRRLTTILLSGLLLAFTSMVVRAKIVASASISPPTERQCREAIAVHLGRYPSNSTCNLIDMLYTADDNHTCQSGTEFLGVRGVEYETPRDDAPDCRRRGCVRPVKPLKGPPSSGIILEREEFPVQETPGGYAAERALSLCDSPCHEAKESSIHRCDALACGVPSWLDEGEKCTEREHKSTRFKSSALVECFCDAKIREKEQQTFRWELSLLLWVISKFKQGYIRTMHHAVCRKFLRERLISKWTDRSLIVVIVSVNALLELIFSIFSKFERHNSVSSSLVNTSVKTFLLSFLNTAVLTPLYNMRCANSDGQWNMYGMSWFCEYVLLGQYSTFSRQWYSAVGTTILQTIMLNMAVNLGARLYMVAVQDPLIVWWKLDSCVTQNQLNDLLTPRRFDIDHRYSFAFTYILCTFVYCSGLPILIPMSAIYFWTSYLADRFLVFRLYKQPPSYDAKLPMLLLKLLPIACVAHLIMSTLVLSNENLVASSSIESWKKQSSSHVLSLVSSSYVSLCKILFGDAGARSLSRVCVAPVFVSALVAITYKIMTILANIYNPELVPIPFLFTCLKIRQRLVNCFAACRRLIVSCCRCRRTAKIAADDEMPPLHTSISATTTGGDENCSEDGDGQSISAATSIATISRIIKSQRTERNVPGGVVRRPTAWRREERNLRMGPLTTRPGFTEEYRCLAPSRASEVMDLVIEKKFAQTVHGSCPPTAHPTSATSSRGITSLRCRCSQLMQAVSFGVWRVDTHTKVGKFTKKGSCKVKPEQETVDRTKQRKVVTGLLLSTARKQVVRIEQPPPQLPAQDPLTKPVQRRPEEEAPRAMTQRRGLSTASTRFKARQIVSGILFAAHRWSEEDAREAIESGWRKVVHNQQGSSSTIGDDADEVEVIESTELLHLPSSPTKARSLLSSAQTAGVVELERIHMHDEKRRGKVMRTWEIIVAEKRLPSYDIMANPNYRLALEFLESVGTFRPKRELVKDIGIFKEQLVRLNDRVRRQIMDKAISNKLQAMRIERVKRREVCRAVCDRLVQDVEHIAITEEAREKAQRAQHEAAAAISARQRTEVQSVVDACVAEVERRGLVEAFRKAGRASAEKARENTILIEVSAAIELCVARVELRAVYDDADAEKRRLADVAARCEVAAVLELCVSSVETRRAIDDASRYRKERDRFQRRLEKPSSDLPLREERIRADTNEHKVIVLEKALEESRALAASYERVALMAETSAKHQLEIFSAKTTNIPSAEVASEIETPREVLREKIRVLEEMKISSSTKPPTQSTATSTDAISPDKVSGPRDAGNRRKNEINADGITAGYVYECAVAREDRTAALLQIREAERLAQAAYAESLVAEEKQTLATTEAQEALTIAEEARSEADNANREKESAILEASESLRLADAAAAETARVDAQREAAVTALTESVERKNAAINRASKLAAELEAASVEVLDARSSRDDSVDRAEKARDACRAAEVVVAAITATLSKVTGQNAAEVAATRRGLEDRAAATEAELRRSESRLAEMTKALRARDAEHVVQTRDSVDVEVRDRKTHEEQLARLRRAADQAQSRADDAVAAAADADFRRRQADSTLASYEADRNAAVHESVEIRSKLIETQSVLHAALNRLPARELDAVLNAGGQSLPTATKSVSFNPIDAFSTPRARQPRFAAEHYPRTSYNATKKSPVVLKHPSHIASALSSETIEVQPACQKSRSGSVIFLQQQHTGHGRNEFVDDAVRLQNPTSREILSPPRVMPSHTLQHAPSDSHYLTFEYPRNDPRRHSSRDDASQQWSTAHRSHSR